MAWLQNLADKAEDLLNKIDKNAATVLNESSAKTDSTLIEIPSEVTPKKIAQMRSSSSVKSLAKLSDSDNEHQDTTNTTVSSMSDSHEDLGISMLTQPEPTTENQLERSVTSSGLSRENSFQMVEEFQINYEEKITKLEAENRNLNKQLLKVQHLYSELQNENLNVQNQLERANESVSSAQNEMEQYKSRAQRILQEKEKLISLKSDTVSQNITEDSVLNDYNTQLRQELAFQQERNNELNQKIELLNIDLYSLQKQYVDFQNSQQTALQTIQDSWNNEQRMRTFAEEEYRLKTKELQSTINELAHQKNLLKLKTKELNEARDRLKESTGFKGNDVESRLHTLTQTLMVKQNTLETVTSERNALRIQLEKLETEHQNVLSQNQRTQIVITDSNETDDVKSQVPKFMVPSPFDAGMTRRVKHAYSSLDAISIRTGVFLRRYPLARVFVFSYMVLLHFLMMIILCSYMPSNK